MSWLQKFKSESLILGWLATIFFFLCFEFRKPRTSSAEQCSAAHAAPINVENVLLVLQEKQKQIAEWQYHYQKGERKLQENFLRSVESNFPCMWGEAVAGRPGTKDGNKWVCGISFIKNPCVVYSFGCDGQFDFELGLSDLQPDGVKCEIHIFDHTWYEENKIPPNVTYHRLGLAPRNDIQPNLKTLNWIMKKLKHTHIDVLKVDIEMAEFDTFGDPAFVWPSVGQFLVELHFHGHESEEQRKSKYFQFLDLMETRNMRLFHTELNIVAPPYGCTELAFIQKEWNPRNKSYV